MTERQGHKAELLAPAGSISVFESAIAAGADAVYIGAPALNARALSIDFTMAEIGAMIDFAHRRNVRLYLAANSLLKEREIPMALEMLANLEALQPDGLIIQDLGVYHLCRKYFPTLRLHASTLLGAHNSLAVRQFTDMGFKRIVLARELTIKEISAIGATADVELEVFIHGALCFSYSGLCLFSSYLGGKSGLRGRCVQPCRRRYSWQHQKGKPGYYFSMNDLCGIDLVHRLRQAGVSSFKIEGRLRSAHYVSSVVQAYRMVLDAENVDRNILQEAKELLDQAMGRKTCRGYFNAPNPNDLIAHHQSGNVGIFLGQVSKNASGGSAFLTLRQELQVGDRLRLHQEKSGERVAFTLKSMSVKGRKISGGRSGDHVMLDIPAAVLKGDSLYKVDSRRARQAERRKPGLDVDKSNQVIKKILQQSKQKAATVYRRLASAKAGSPRQSRAGRGGKGKGTPGSRLNIYVKIDDLQLLKSRLPVIPDLLMVELNRQTFDAFMKQGRLVKKFQHKMAWCLPPVIHEKEIEFFSQAISRLLKNKFWTWEIGHLGQLQFFQGNRRLNLLGNYTLNVLNSQSLQVLNTFNVRRSLAAIEIDRESLKDLSDSRASAGAGVDLGLTVYGTPPLFTARVSAPHFIYGQPFLSPKGEAFILHHAGDGTAALALNPFSLLPNLNELAGTGLKYGVIDLRGRKVSKKEIEEIGREITGKRSKRKLSTFNYNGGLQ